MLPALSPSKFIVALEECALAPKFKAKLCISLTGMIISGKDVTEYIVSLAWKATRYRFRYTTSSPFACRL